MKSPLIVDINGELIIGKSELLPANLTSGIIVLGAPRVIKVMPDEHKRPRMMLLPLIGQPEELHIRSEKCSYVTECKDESINDSYTKATSNITLLTSAN